MYIKTENPATQRLSTPFTDEPVSFNDEGVARVAADVGEQLVDEYDALTVESREGNDESDEVAA